MHTLSALASAIGILLWSSQVFAEDLTIRLTDPNFKVVVPGAPQVQFHPHPSASQNPAALLLGSTPDGFNVSALSEKADGASAQQCASWLVGSTISRYKPDLATVQIIPAGANAWVLLYALSQSFQSTTIRMTSPLRSSRVANMVSSRDRIVR